MGQSKRSRSQHHIWEETIYVCHQAEWTEDANSDSDRKGVTESLTENCKVERILMIHLTWRYSVSKKLQQPQIIFHFTRSLERVGMDRFIRYPSKSIPSTFPSPLKKYIYLFLQGKLKTNSSKETFKSFKVRIWAVQEWSYAHCKTSACKLG